MPKPFKPVPNENNGMVDTLPVIVSILEVPHSDDVKGFIKEEDLVGLAGRDAKTIIAMSKLEQWSNFHTEALVETNRHLILLEAESARRIRELMQIKEEQKRHEWGLSIAKWASMTIGAGIISAFVKYLLEKH